MSAAEQSSPTGPGEPASGRPPASQQLAETSTAPPSAHEKACYLWCSLPRTWLEASMSPRRRIDGIAVVPPGARRRPFTYAENPHSFYFIPGRRKQFTDRRQEQLGEAYKAIEVEWQKATGRARGGTRASASKTIWSVPAIIVYTPRLRSTSKVVLLNLHLMRSRAPAGGYLSSGWIARGLLVARTLPEYRRRYADGTPYTFRDPRNVDEALALLRRLEVIDYSLVERPDGQAYDFRFIDGWQDRLGPMPVMPAPQKVRPWSARHAHPPGPATARQAPMGEPNSPQNGHHNPRDGHQILRNRQQMS